MIRPRSELVRESAWQGRRGTCFKVDELCCSDLRAAFGLTSFNHIMSPQSQFLNSDMPSSLAQTCNTAWQPGSSSSSTFDYLDGRNHSPFLLLSFRA
jgi:hypothetical protein